MLEEPNIFLNNYILIVDKFNVLNTKSDIDLINFILTFY